MPLPPDHADFAESPPSLFVTTRWSVVMTARDKASPESEEALETLCKGYWHPLHASLRQCLLTLEAGAA
jgi:hypothetical protein